MAKSKKTAEAVEESVERKAESGKEPIQGTGNGKQGTELPVAGCRFPVEGIREALLDCLDQVDPEITENNPVWHWALCDDHCTFVFRDGRKVVISF